ncbi:3-hydroxyisobutyrate dehydrogenase-like beta-hydroxyacid dehydrogenase [Williamsia limnetica]|uniref:3-hydroxyisobutyrate dehydrogenase-like beta-hydroxyacid dehydrogenase n=1 Tax=Williamsia limnetica TaxID=882452 RepID=A0A318RKX6_WILLI|nr:NAD(P)-dependent oxidoreductase [Williamsia limnetica]PYE16329.1 3-hydroxyisobutyrate dehydrogenase-like beta-hydroxyacid dehydrogenase [Williamsia limnetica]
MQIGFVGTGRMGLPMVRRLIAGGHQVRALTRSAESRDVVAAEGAEAVADISEVGLDSDVVIVCVFTDEQVLEVCLKGTLIASMPPGSALVIHTTGSPATATEIAQRAKPFGVRVVDAPVSGGPHNIAAGELTMFAGGDPEVVEQVRPALQCYGDRILPVGALGNGQRVKLVNNALFAAQIGLLREGVRLGAELGIDETTLLGALPYASSNSRVLTGVAARGSVSAFSTAVGEFVDKDVAVVRRVATELGSELGLIDEVIGSRFDSAGVSAPTA